MTPLMHESGYIHVFFPIIEPGFITMLHPISTISPIIAPNFFSPVSIAEPAQFTFTRVLSFLTFDVTAPAPICARQPKIESPT